MTDGRAYQLCNPARMGIFERGGRAPLSFVIATRLRGGARVRGILSRAGIIACRSASRFMIDDVAVAWAIGTAQSDAGLLCR
jgi:hypothetical protein